MKRIYTVLLSLLILTLIVSPLAVFTGRSGDFIEFLLLLNLATAALCEPSGNQRNRILLILGGAICVRLVGTTVQNELANVAAAFLWVALAIAAAYRAFRYSMTARVVDTEHICAALSVYMLLGQFYAFAYWKIESILPGTFALSESALRAGGFDLPAAMYLSFVTIATVGFGDIVPCTPVTRGLVVTEAILGQFYMVVLVARLVGLYSSRNLSKEQ